MLAANQSFGKLDEEAIADLKSSERLEAVARIVFIGRDTDFNRRFVKELSRSHRMVACMFVEQNRKSLGGMTERIRKRISKYGILKVLDELAFHVLDRSVLRRNESVFFKEKPEFFQPTQLDMPLHYWANVNCVECYEVLKELSPDVILSMCCNVHFSRSLFLIPNYGTYVLHEGILPQYRGLHSTLWALAKKDYDNLGCTLFQVNERIDDGKIILQHKINGPSSCQNWGWAAHKAIIDSIEPIANVLAKLKRDGYVAPIGNIAGERKYYTWMRLTQFVALRLKGRQTKRTCSA